MANNRRVLLTAGAESDLESIYEYIAEKDCIENANDVLDEIVRVTNDLAVFPERGSYPRELLNLGIKSYRQVFFKPYRVIYSIADEHVAISMIADGRRDMQSLLARRLLAS